MSNVSPIRASALICILIGCGSVAARLAAQDNQSQRRPSLPSAESYVDKALWSYRRGMFLDAIDATRAAIALRRDYAQAWNIQAAAYNAVGRWEEGQKAAEMAVHLEPDEILAINNLAWAKLNLENTPESRLTVSMTYYQQGKFEESIEAARDALKLRPGFAEAWNNIAAGLNSLAMWDEAERAAEQAILLKPDYPLARNNLEYAKVKKAAAAK